MKGGRVSTPEIWCRTKDQPVNSINRPGQGICKLLVFHPQQKLSITRNGPQHMSLGVYLGKWLQSWLIAE